MSLGQILLILLLVALNGFFVSVEFSAIASRRARLDMLPGANSHAGQVVRTWLEQPGVRDRLIAASQLGITAVSLALGAVGENAFAAWLEPHIQDIKLPSFLLFIEKLLPVLPLAISLVVITSLHVVMGEQVPKVAVLRGPERFALLAAPVMEVFSSLFKGFIDLLDWATRQILSLLGIPSGDMRGSIASAEELKLMVTGPEVEGVIDLPEREMLSAVIDFGELVVRQVSIPRTEIIAVEASTPYQQVLEQVMEKGLTKVPVYEENLDHMIGIIHLRDLVRAMDDPAKETLIARKLAREALFVPETISVNNLLHEFRARRTHMAIVLDEFGGTYGLVTLQDLLDEIIGEVQDPFDATVIPAIQSLPDGTALIDGMTLIEEINEHFGLNLVEPFYDTIAGYLLGRLGKIPQPGDIYEDKENGILLKVEAMDRLRISRISLSRIL